MADSPHPYLAGSAEPRILAHRGFVPEALAAQGVAENTLSAFRAAVEAGASHLETDCHLTADGEAVLIHDPELTRIADDPSAVSSVTRRELAAIMRDRGGLITLGELLEEFPEERINLDIKVAEASAQVARLVAPHTERVLLAAFNDACRRRTLAAVAATGAALPATSAGQGQMIRILIALAARSRRGLDRAFAGIDALQIPERQGPLRVLSPRLIDEAHRRGVEVHVWTVNEPERMRALVDAGVDGIVTDRTDLAMAALRD